MRNPIEWWITPTVLESGREFEIAEKTKPRIWQHHVIEYSAYQAERDRSAKLEAALEEMMRTRTSDGFNYESAKKDLAEYNRASVFPETEAREHIRDLNRDDHYSPSAFMQGAHWMFDRLIKERDEARANAKKLGDECFYGMGLLQKERAKSSRQGPKDE